MKIRKSTAEDVGSIMKIYERARAFMAETGNPHQWGDAGWPFLSEIEDDNANGTGYVCVLDETDELRKVHPEEPTQDHAENRKEELPGDIVGAFSLLYGEEPEPDYGTIEGPGWRRDGRYAVIHRVASSGTRKGVAAFCFAWAAEQYHYLRLDTHADNKVMQSAVEQFGFVYCGTVRHEDAPGDWPAYDYIKKEEPNHAGS